MVRQAVSKTKTGKLEPFRGIKPVGKPRPVGVVVYESLKEAILKGDLAPGLRLVEHQVSLQMKTSRIPVREALKRLEQEGLVEKPDLRGFVVKNLTKAEILETFAIRAVLESYAALLATENITDGTLAKLEGSIAAYREALKVDDTAKLMLLNTQFHEIIYRAAGSQKLYALINNFKDSIARYRRALLTCLDYARISINDHVEMVEAMREKDTEKVEKLVRMHILRGKDIVIREMEEGKLI